MEQLFVVAGMLLIGFFLVKYDEQKKDAKIYRELKEEEEYRNKRKAREKHENDVVKSVLKRMTDYMEENADEKGAVPLINPHSVRLLELCGIEHTKDTEEIMSIVGFRSDANSKEELMEEYTSLRDEDEE